LWSHKGQLGFSSCFHLLSCCSMNFFFWFFFSLFHSFSSISCSHLLLCFSPNNATIIFLGLSYTLSPILHLYLLLLFSCLLCCCVALQLLLLFIYLFISLMQGKKNIGSLLCYSWNWFDDLNILDYIPCNTWFQLEG
jgi:hypothetical protein